MERVAADVESFHFGVGDLDALLIGPLIERTLDLEPGFGGRRGDQLDYCGAADEWLGAPVLRDVAEQPVLDLVPFRCAGRIGAAFDRGAISPPTSCTSPSHSRERALLDPPQSAVIISS